MNTQNEKTIAMLNELIETCEDGAKGFAQAAEGVRDLSVRAILSQYGAERGRFASELQQEVKKLGGKPKESGTAGGAMHRGWFNLKAAVIGKDDHAILAECERGEDVAKEAYQKAVSGSDLPGTVLGVVQRQYGSVKAAHDRVKILRDRQGATA
jgi:uncharacterized protein (TIGR02284 family)